ncbi:Tim44/TimA family putative adaptor protein [Rickettsiales bacterium]|nr:Tim44/TimA family putative adaptor protein [Rickettsiales bacterium]
MSNSLSIFEIVFFAVIAIVLIIKLRSILGKNYNDEEFIEKLKKEQEQRSKKMVNVTPTAEEKNNNNKKVHNIEIQPKNQYRHAEHTHKTTEETKDKIKEIKKDMPSFDVGPFIQNCSEAFSSIVQAYDDGDLSQINSIASKSLRESLQKSINTTKEIGLRERLILVKIKDISISSIKKEDNKHNIEVLFESQQMHYTVDKENKVVSGNDIDCSNSKEIWTIQLTQKEDNPIIITKIQNIS